VKIEEKFGFKVGDECKLSGEYFSYCKPRGCFIDKAKARRFKVVGFAKGWHGESIRVERLDLTSGRIEYYHHSFLQKLKAGEKY